MARSPRGSADTLETIADLAGVSRSTVSRVLNDDRHVKAATRKRVLEVVERERYEPNRAARGLASGRTGTIGVVVSVDLAQLFSDPYFPTLLQAIYNSARTRELVMSVWILEDESDTKTINEISRGSVLDGAIVAAGTTDDPMVEALWSSNTPFVLLGRPADDAALSYVDVDNRSAACAVTEHLLRLGRKRIATITGPDISIAAIDRKAGYVDALRRAGTGIIPELVYEGDYSAKSGTLGVQRLMRHNPDAIVAANDVMAMAAMNELAAMGVRVPEDVAVTGFDDLAATQRATPSLTTVRQSISLLASEAVRVLTDLVGDRSLSHRQVVIPTELIVRDSCGATIRQHESVT